MNKIKNLGKLSKGLFAGVGMLVAVFVVMSLPSITNAATFNRQLSIGMSGSDVSSLQSFLAQDKTIYPQGLVTGYFGFLTKAAVSNYQSKNGIDSVGRVGPITLMSLNSQFALGIVPSLPNTGSVAPSINSLSVNLGRDNATINWNTDESAKGVVYYNTSPLILSTSLTDVGVNGGYTAMTDSSFRYSQNVALTNLMANTTYYYMVYTTDQNGNVSVSWPSTFRTTN